MAKKKIKVSAPISSDDWQTRDDFRTICQAKEIEDVTVLFAAIQPKVKEMLDRGGITELLGEGAFFGNAMDAIGRADERAK